MSSGWPAPSDWPRPGCAAYRRWSPSAATASACPRRSTPRRSSVGRSSGPAARSAAAARSVGACGSGRNSIRPGSQRTSCTWCIRWWTSRASRRVSNSATTSVKLLRIGQRLGRLDGAARRDAAAVASRAAAPPPPPPPRGAGAPAVAAGDAAAVLQRLQRIGGRGQVGGVAQADQRHLGGAQRARARRASPAGPSAASARPASATPCESLPRHREALRALAVGRAGRRPRAPP